VLILIRVNGLAQNKCKQITHIAGSFKNPLKETKFFLLILFLSFSILLVFETLNDLSFIQTDGTAAIPFAPEVISPCSVSS